MIYYLPLDVEKHILNYLINGFSIKKLSNVCKNWKKIISNSDYKKKELDLYNQTGLLLEDKLIRLEKDYVNLAVEWEKFHSYRWEKINRNIVENPDEITNLWKIGDYVDVKDRVNAWAPAKIIEIDCGTTDSFFIKPVISYRRYLVEFLGWNKSFNEWVTSTYIRKLGYHSILPYDKINSIGSERSWAIMKIEDEWRMVIIRGIIPPLPDEEDISGSEVNDTSGSAIEDDEDFLDNLPLLPRTPLSGNYLHNNEFIIIDTNDGLVSLKKEEINNRIFCSSNMVSFLLTSHRFHPKTRTNFL